LLRADYPGECQQRQREQEVNKRAGEKFPFLPFFLINRERRKAFVEAVGASKHFSLSNFLRCHESSENLI
jgi:hypothetical protein